MIKIVIARILVTKKLLDGEHFRIHAESESRASLNLTCMDTLPTDVAERILMHVFLQTDFEDDGDDEDSGKESRVR